MLSQGVRKSRTFSYNPGILRDCTVFRVNFIAILRVRLAGIPTGMELIISGILVLVLA